MDLEEAVSQQACACCGGPSPLDTHSEGTLLGGFSMTPHSVIRSPVFFACMYMFVHGVCVHVCVDTYVQVCVHICIEWPGVDIRCLPRFSSTLFFETQSLTELNRSSAVCLDWLARKPQ